MVVDETELIVGDLRTGLIHARLPYAGIKWGQRLNNHGPVSATLRPHSAELARHDLRNLLLPVKQFMAVARGRTILEAGPIWNRDYDPDSRDLKIDGLGLWSVFDRRKTLPGAALNWSTNPRYANLDIVRGHLGAIARELVRVSLQDNPYAAGGLPVVLPPDIPGTAHERHYKGYNLAWIGDDLRELTKVQTGPDLRFRPRFVEGVDNKIEWVLEHGVWDLLNQQGPDWQWDAKVERSGVAGLGVSQDGSKMSNQAWTPGSGQEQEMRLAASRNLSLLSMGFPWLESEESATDVEDQGVLQSIADRKIADTSRPWETWSPSVRADRDPVLGSYLPGDWAVFNMPDDHPILPPGLGKVRVRILAIDGDHTNTVKLSVAPIQGSI